MDGRDVLAIMEAVGLEQWEGVEEAFKYDKAGGGGGGGGGGIGAEKEREQPSAMRS
jgi:hypothetical protein